MDVSENNGTPKSSIFIRFSIINHPFGVPLFLETPIYQNKIDVSKLRDKSYGKRDEKQDRNSSSQHFLICDWGGSLRNPGQLAGECSIPNMKCVPFRWT